MLWKIIISCIVSQAAVSVMMSEVMMMEEMNPMKTMKGRYNPGNPVNPGIYSKTQSGKYDKFAPKRDIIEEEPTFGLDKVIYETNEMVYPQNYSTEEKPVEDIFHSKLNQFTSEAIGGKLFKSKAFQKPLGTLNYSSPVYGDVDEVEFDSTKFGKNAIFPRVAEELERIATHPERFIGKVPEKRVPFTSRQGKKVDTSRILSKIIGGLRKEIPLTLLTKYGLATPEVLQRYNEVESGSESSESSESSEEDIENAFLHTEGAELQVTPHVQILCKHLHITPETLSKLLFRLKMTPVTLLLAISKVPVDLTFVELILKKIAYLPFKFEMSPSVLIMCLKKLAMIPEVVTMSGYNVFVLIKKIINTVHHDWSETEFVTPVIGEKVKGVSIIALADLLMKLHQWQHKWQKDWTNDIESEQTFPGFGKMNQTIVRPEEREDYDTEFPEITSSKYMRKFPTEINRTQRNVLSGDYSNRLNLENPSSYPRGLKY